MARLRVAALWLLAAGCVRCGRPAEGAAGSAPAARPQQITEGARAKPAAPEAPPAAPYVRQVKKLPPLPRQARVEQIYVGDSRSNLPWTPAKARKRSREEAKAIATKLAGELRRGADFNELAKRESDWPMAARSGGVLGIVTEGEVGMLPIVDPRIFSMRVGEVAEPFESPIGFHVLERLPMVRLAHILIAVHDGKNGVPPRTLDEARAVALSAEEQLKGGKTFEVVAFDLSDDLGSAARGGDLGGIDERTALAAPVRAAAEALQPGQVSAPIAQPGGFEILKRLE
jgi:peptidyl-prolyl cis-trans isomerase SurA